MVSEREYLEKRYQNVCKRIKQPNIYDKDSQGNFCLAYQPDQSIDYNLILERRVIHKLLNEVEEGQVQKALVSWHGYLSDQWREHCIDFHDMKMAHSEWESLAWSIRQNTPEPPKPPKLKVKDVKGIIWEVDQRLLNVLLDIHKRLTKWLEDDKELDPQAVNV